MRKVKAFTLLEVLIAMVILAIAFIAILKTTQANINSTIKVRQSLAANWVAMNVFSAIQIGLVPKPTDGTPGAGDESIFNQKWQWLISTDQTADKSTYERITIDVSRNGKRYQRLIGFIKR